MQCLHNISNSHWQCSHDAMEEKLLPKWPLLIADDYFCFFCFGEDVPELVEARVLLSFTDQALVVCRPSLQHGFSIEARLSLTCLLKS